MTKEVCIVGFGRLGETLANVLKPSCTITVCEVVEAKIRRALEQGFQTMSIEDIGMADVVIICVPISQFEATITKLSGYTHPGMLVMDVCSVKVFPAQIMESVLPEGVFVIATHPLFGPDSVGKGLNKLTMITYPVRVGDELYREWDTIWRGLGLKVVEASPEEHDKVTAYTLGMTHFFGRIMDELKLKPQAITTVSYDALYEVMSQTNRDTWQLFHDMQHYNPYAKEMRNDVYRAIREVEAKLDEAICIAS